MRVPFRIALASLALLAACKNAPVPPPLTAPDAPAQVTATAGGSSIALAWATAPRATSYVVLRGDAAAGPFDALGTVFTNAYTDAGLPDGTTFYYEVRAANPAGASAASAIVSATTPGTKPVAPLAPTGLTATGGSGIISLTWSAPANAATFRVLRAFQSGGPYALAGRPTAPSYVDQGLDAGVHLFYAVEAVSGDGAISAKSNEASATTTVSVAPGAPASLAAAGGTLRMTLTWPAVPTASGYLVLRGTNAGGPYSVQAANTSSTTATDGSLADGTDYFYVVEATNAAGTGPASPEANAFTLPAQVAGLTAAGAARNIALSWTAVTSATKYQVFAADTAGGINATGTPLAEPVTNSFTESGLTDSQSRWYAVRAVNTTGSGPLSITATTATLPPATTAPAAPTGLTATGGSKQIALAWTASTGASSYSVFKGTAAGAHATPVITNLIAPSYTELSLGDGAQFFYVVRAVNAIGSSGDSNEANAFTLPAQVTLTATGGTKQIALTWPAVAGASDYLVKRGTAAGGPYGDLTASQGTVQASACVNTTCSFTDTIGSVTTDGAGPFYYVVQAHNSAGSSAAASPEAHAVVLAAVPTGLAAAAVAGTLKRIALQWSAAAGASASGSSYSLLRATAQNGTYTKQADLTASACSASVCIATDSPPADGTTYWYQVAAYNSAQVPGPVSTPAQATTIPPQVGGFNAAAAGATSITLNWTGVTVQTGASITYQVFRATTAGVTPNGTPVQTKLDTGAGAAAYSVTDTVPLANTKYYYVIIATDTGHVLDSPPSAEVNATTPLAPTLTATRVQNALSVNLAWNLVAGATGYDVKRLDGTSGGCPATYPGAGSWTDVTGAGALPSNTTSTPDTTFAATDAGHTWCYAVIPSGAGTLPSNVASALLAAPPPTTTFTAVTLAPGSGGPTTGTTVRVSWAYAGAPAGTASVDIYRCSTAGTVVCTPMITAPVKQFASPGISGTFDDTGLTPSTTYSYSALGTNASGQYSTGALTGSATTGPSAPQGPAANAHVVGTAPAINVITATWNKITDGTATGYLVLRGATSASHTDFGPGILVAQATCGLTTCSYDDNNSNAGLPNGATYHYVVQAVSDRGGAGTFTSAASSDVGASTQSNVPANLTAAATAPGTLRQIRLDWGAATSMTSYDIYRSATGTPTGSPYCTTGNLVTFTDTGGGCAAGGGLAAGTTYHYVVTNPGAASAKSNEATALTAPLAPSPLNVSAADGPSCMASKPCVTLTWSAPATATSYNVYRADLGMAPIYTTSTTAFVDTNLSADTSYSYAVEAVNTGGASPQAAATAKTLPASITMLTAVPSSSALQVTLNWVLPPNSTATGIWIYRTLNGQAFSYGSPLATNQPVGSPFTYLDTAVTADTSYDYEARLGIGGSVSSVSSNTVANKLTIPAAPVVSFAATTAAVTSECATPDCIIISWPTLPADVLSYTVEGSGNGSVGSYSTLPGTPACAAGICRFAEQGLGTGTTRFYRVWATNATGAGPKGSSGITSTLPGAPGPLTPTPGRGTVDLAWNAASGATQYKIQRLRADGSEGATFTGGVIVSSAFLTCTDRGATPGAAPDCSLGALAAGQSYSYKITAQLVVGGTTNDGGAALFSAVAVFPATPSGFTATRSAPSTVTLSWSSSACATSYDLLQSPTSTAGSFVAANPPSKAGLASPCSSSGTVTQDVNPLSDGSTYYFQIAARNTGATGDAASASLPTAAAPVTLQPPTPTGLGATPGDRTVGLVWTASAGAATYSIYRADLGATALMTGVAGTSYSDTLLTNGTSYTYQVSAVNPGGESAKSTAASATPNSGLLAPGSLRAIALNVGARVIWPTATGATGYTVFQRATSGGSGTAVTACTNVSGGCSMGSCSCIVTGLTNHTTYYFVVQSVAGGSNSANSPETSTTPARELCVSLPEMSATVAIDADTVVSGGASVDAAPRRWFGNVTQLALPVAVAIDQANDELYALNQAANSVSIYKPRSAAGNTPPTRAIAGLATTLSTPVGMALDNTTSTSPTLFVIDTFGVTGRVLVFDGTPGAASAPLRKFAVPSGPPTAIALGPTPAQFMITNGTSISVYNRTGWTTASPPSPVKTWTVTGQSGISALAPDASHNELWIGSNSSSTLLAFDSTSAGGVATVIRSFQMTNRLTAALVYDPNGDGVNGEVIVGAYTNNGLSNLYSFSRTATGAASATYTLTDTSPATLGRPTSLALDKSGTNDFVVVANFPNSGLSGGSPYLQGISTYKRRLNPALKWTLDGPYQATSGASTDEPGALAATSRTLDHLWVTNLGLAGGSSIGGSSQTAAYSMTTATSTPSSLLAIDNTVLASLQAFGVAVNETNNEVYLSDGQGDLKVFTESTSAFLNSASSTATFASPTGLFWDGRAAELKLYVAQQTVNTGSGYVDVLKRAADGSFSRPSLGALPNPIVSAGNLQFPSAVWVAVPSGAGNAMLWVANSSKPSGAPGGGGAGAARIDLTTGVVALFSNSGDFYSPAAVVTDSPSPATASSARVYLGVSPNGAAASGNFGVEVLSGALTGVPALLGTLQVVGGTHRIGGLAWCN